MEQQTANMGMLDLMVGPCFCVSNLKIVKVNQDAARFFLTEGMEILPLLTTGISEYVDFSGGCLYLELNIGGRCVGASVVRMDGFDVFVLDQAEGFSELQALALAAQHLRDPITSISACVDAMTSQISAQEDPYLIEQSQRMRRGLSRLLRIVGNMSDADRRFQNQELCDIGSVFAEVFDKAQTLVAGTHVTLTYSGLEESIFCMADAQELERAVLNLISNSIKYTPSGGSIQASLIRKGKMLYLQIQDNGPGISEDILRNVFRRFLRQPGIEDPRNGIGLGMVLVRTAAAHHGGTVLIDRPGDCGTRVTFTMSIRQNADSMLRSPVMRVDYAGGRDHALIELSEVLPSDSYQ